MFESIRKKLNPDEVRSFVFGVEDSLVSTVGLVSGVAAADVGNTTVVMTGTVLVIVEAFSMAVGTFLSDTSAHEFEEQGDVPVGPALGSSLIMFVSYIVCGFLVLAPYAVFENGRAFAWSVLISLAALFVLGSQSARLSNGRPVRKGVMTLLVGGAAVLIGALIGSLFR